MEMNIGLIIQVRVGSSRLPSKVFKKNGHKTTIKHLIDRLEPLKKIFPQSLYFSQQTYQEKSKMNGVKQTLFLETIV